MAHNPQDIPPEVVERMARLCRSMGEQSEYSGPSKNNPDYNEARAIAALLPEPVDPALRQAREFVARACEWFDEKPGDIPDLIRRGDWDTGAARGLVFDLYEALRSPTTKAAGRG